MKGLKISLPRMIIENLVKFRLFSAHNSEYSDLCPQVFVSRFSFSHSWLSGSIIEVFYDQFHSFNHKLSGVKVQVNSYYRFLALSLSTEPYGNVCSTF